eukprot:CAMPEP_0114117592 /NCGR_PEP_ID=MMETSP0043_2-20121206/5119_1 /TAXON_ID=464988 /ORGANISM="Hemiselmis andersenii, Strain CCMP644" /LENGTH=64 /DNA_ID=CAMNT_0001210001 /DNA_START=4217 /DNA_END=4411 /DNA_ORIENTATION=+
MQLRVVIQYLVLHLEHALPLLVQALDARRQLLRLGLGRRTEALRLTQGCLEPLDLAASPLHIVH